jgi:hypothetical protein
MPTWPPETLRPPQPNENNLIFQYLNRSASLHSFCFALTKGVREILGLVPSNPRRNTSETSFEVLRTGNNAATRCRSVAALLPLLPITANEEATKKQQSGNMLPLSNYLSSINR